MNIRFFEKPKLKSAKFEKPKIKFPFGEKSKQMPDLYVDTLYIHSHIQIPQAYSHLARKPNHVLQKAIIDATQPVNNTLGIVRLHNHLVKHQPTLPKGRILNAMSFIAIPCIYCYFTTYGIAKATCWKLHSMLPISSRFIPLKTKEHLKHTRYKLSILFTHQALRKQQSTLRFFVSLLSVTR